MDVERSQVAERYRIDIATHRCFLQFFRSTQPCTNLCTSIIYSCVFDTWCYGRLVLGVFIIQLFTDRQLCSRSTSIIHAQVLRREPCTEIPSDFPSNCIGSRAYAKLGKRSSGPSQIHRHQRRSVQCSKRIFLLAHGVAYASKTLRRVEERLENWHERFGRRQSFAVSKEVSNNTLINVQSLKNFPEQILSALSDCSFFLASKFAAVFLVERECHRVNNI